ncbi:DUF1697 domain-containing protein [Sphingomonas sp. RB56-2]|uniref:DUF1697 domain-containing protein n=1 Tax=Sphingomonas brevis TaxID=2908206 RepID=A0ABT0SD41_9SPHN|nr:DUF1697 domain-containing protein [Sphingomonas brevis]
MTAFVAMVRAVNVSGTGKLPKEELTAIGKACGFKQVRTFINSGNLLFASDLAESTVKERIEQRLVDYFGKPVPAFVRNAREMAEAVKKNPFSDDKPSRVMAHFVDEEPVKAMIDEARDVEGERLALGPRLLYVSYGEGIGKTKLKLPAVKQGTARNMNSVARMAELLAGME